MEFTKTVVKEIVSRCTRAETGARNIDAIIDRNIAPEISTQLLGFMAEGEEPTLLKIGKDMFDDKGGCIECHPAAPDPDIEFPILTALLSEVEKHAGEKGRDTEEFLFEALVNPGAYVADGMDDIMPATQDELSNEEMIAVAAYLQSKGGKVTVSLDSLPKLTKELEKAGGQ